MSTPEKEVFVVNRALGLDQERFARLQAQVQQALGPDTPVIQGGGNLDFVVGVDRQEQVSPAASRRVQSAAHEEADRVIMDRLRESGALATIREASTAALRDNNPHTMGSGRHAILDYRKPNWVQDPAVAEGFQRQFGSPGGAVPRGRGRGFTYD
jgi:hypothetical protein